MRPTFSNENGGTFVLIEPGIVGVLTITEPFFIGARPVTQVEWTTLMGNNPAKFQDGWSAGLRPIESVSWLDCQKFIEKLNEIDTDDKMGLSGLWRLPTADEWEFACRAGTETRWFHSSRDSELDEVAWHAGNSGASTREVGQKKANAWGLHDCHGNVSEWTSSEVELKRITKGGSWLMESESTTSAAKGLSAADKRSDAIGFRLVWAPL
ncbi:MAG: formylglycine-generating enzyme family protein [Euryarchaeota archaeon]|nr:formylglycine-generating enzyme family protein [Euryarchaeota archaeon]MBT5184149.1 formylglycine-generating enzyme family protein [Euryarchaeota archaeon]